MSDALKRLREREGGPAYEATLEREAPACGCTHWPDGRKIYRCWLDGAQNVTYRTERRRGTCLICGQGIYTVPAAAS